MTEQEYESAPYLVKDRLTGLLNVDAFYSEAEKAVVDRNQNCDQVFVYFNVDNFKGFNNEYGYDEGDKFLKELATMLETVYKGCLVGRTSNDHFIVLTDEIGLEARIRLLHEKVHVMQHDVHIELYAGIYYYEEGVSIALAHDRAKIACDALRNDYSGIFRYYDAELREKITKEKYILDNLENALEQEWIQVYYQPIRRVYNSKICAGEALARWHDPDKGILPPDEFIPVLEKRHLIHKLDRYMVEHVCKDLAYVNSQKMNVIPVSVNFSRLDFRHMDVYKMLMDMTVKYGVSHKSIICEVTESALNTDTEKLIYTLDKLREAGFEIWLDDFGSDYSSLNTLQNYKFDLLKIDMNFMKHFASNPNSRTIVAAIVDMAKRLHMRVLTEGVETKEQYDFLWQVGCDKVQGYYISRPKPLSELISMNSPTEDEDESELFAKLGQVNFMNPASTPEIEGENAIDNMMPVSLVHYKDGYMKFIYSNVSFLNCLNSLGTPTVERAEYDINDARNKLKKRLEDLAAKTHLSQEMEHVNFLWDGYHVSLSVKELAANTDSQVFFVSIINLNNLDNERKLDNLETSLSFIYSIYDRVDNIDIKNDKIETIYLSEATYRARFEGLTVSQAIDTYAKKDIVPEDQEKFLEFFDMSTIEDRILEHGKDYLVSAIRTKTLDGKGKEQLYLLIRVNDGKSIRYLSCVRDIVDEDANSLRKNVSM